MRRRFVLLLLVLPVALAVWGLRRPPTVDVLRPTVREVRELVVTTGRLEAEANAALGFEGSGVLADVLVDRGQRVTRGQVLAKLDAALAEQAVEEARARLETARAELARVLRGPTPEEVQKARAALRAAEVGGRWELLSAARRVDALRQGRAEAVRLAEAGLRQAEAGLRAAEQSLTVQRQAVAAARLALEQAESELRRLETLYASGAVASVEVERARVAAERARTELVAASERASAEEARVAAAREQVAAAREQVALAARPSSQEQLQSAEAEARALAARVEAEVQSAWATLTALLRSPRPEEVRVAWARYREAEELLQTALRRLDRTVLRAPYAGQVVEVHRERGATVLAGEPVVTLADLQTLTVVVELDEDVLPRIRVGQRAFLSLPGSPESQLEARVVAVDPRVDSQRGVGRARLRPRTLPPAARVGATLDVNLEVAVWPRAQALPLETVLSTASGNSVLVVASGSVQVRPVRVLGRSDRWVAVEGLGLEELVVRDPTRVRPGQRVRSRLVPTGE